MYTVFSDSTAALCRAQTDRLGPGQAFARAIEVAERPTSRTRMQITPRRTPAHREVEGNEVADDYAGEAAKSPRDAADRRYLWEASLVHLTRKTAEAKSQTTGEWIAGHVRSRRRYRPLGARTSAPL